MKTETETTAYIAAQALAGMMANPAWMALAKEECGRPGQGDIPQYFARIAARYARETLFAVKVECYEPV